MTKIKVSTKNGRVFVKPMLPFQQLAVILHTPAEVNELINDLVKAKSEAFPSGAESHKRKMTELMAEGGDKNDRK